MSHYLDIALILEEVVGVLREVDKLLGGLPVGISDIHVLPYYEQLSVRGRKCLMRAGIETVSELCGKTEDDLLDTKNAGKTTVEEIRTFLGRNNLYLRGEADAEGEKVQCEEKSKNEKAKDGFGG